MPQKTSNTQRAALRALGKAATPGPWLSEENCVYVEPGNVRWWIANTNTIRGASGSLASPIAEAETEAGLAPKHHMVAADAAYIAACSPEVIEGLLDDLDAAEREIATLKDDCGGFQAEARMHEAGAVRAAEEVEDAKDAIATLEAREKRLREALKHAAACRFPFCEECERLTRALAEPDARGTT